MSEGSEPYESFVGAVEQSHEWLMRVGCKRQAVTDHDVRYPMRLAKNCCDVNDWMTDAMEVGYVGPLPNDLPQQCQESPRGRGHASREASWRAMEVRKGNGCESRIVLHDNSVPGP